MRMWAILGVLVPMIAGAFAAPPVPVESWDAGMVIIVEDKPGLASEAEPIFLASNHVGWDPGSEEMILERRSDGRWQIVLPKPEPDMPPLRFKFTRGNWDLVEIAEDLSDIMNREAPEIDPDNWDPARPVVLEFVVEKWADQKPDVAARRALDPYRTINATGDVRRLQVVGGAGPAAGLTRDALVWLPPGYDDPENADREYPVLYLMDGQNIFEQLPNVPGEWRVDETATHLVEQGLLRPLIIVGIPHAGTYRINEYLPFAAYNATPSGDDFLDFLTGEVMPRVERAFRVSTAREDTGIGGSSLGALISIYACARHADEFGLLLAESPVQVGPESRIWRILRSAGETPERVYVGVGDLEAGEDAGRDLNNFWVFSAERLHDFYEEQGVPDFAVRFTRQAGAMHTESAWASRFPAAVQHLFGKPE